MKKKMIADTTFILAILLFVSVAMKTIGGIVAKRLTERSLHGKAVELGYAEWKVVGMEGGTVEFRWKTNVVPGRTIP